MRAAQQATAADGAPSLALLGGTPHVERRVARLINREQGRRFGAELLATSPSLISVRQAENPDGTKWIDTSLSSMGTRHRSAMRMCSSLEHCVAVVVSQDGPVRAIRRAGPHVYTWPDVGMGDLTL